MEEVLSKFHSIVENPIKTLAHWKEQTKGKIVGCFPMYTPEEIIHAAGILPATLLRSYDELTAVEGILQPYLCSLVRSKFDSMLKGDLNFLDGVVFPDVCLLQQQTPDVWYIHKPEGFQYPLPLVKGHMGLPSRWHYLTAQFNHLRASLEKYFGQKITDERLHQSIAIYNRNRLLLDRLYQVRLFNPGLFRASDMVAVVASGMLMPKEEHNELLTDLLVRVEGAKTAPDGRARIVLSGHLCDKPEDGLLKIIDGLEAVVVDDDLYTGRRYFTTRVSEVGDPVEALAQRYISGIYCPTKQDVHEEWAHYLSVMVKRARAKGLIMLIIRFCEPHAFDWPALDQKLTTLGIPHSYVEVEHGGALEPIRTRLQAFVEILKEV